MSGLQTFFHNRTTNGSSSPVKFTYPMGQAKVTAWGTWDSGTIELFTVLSDGTQIPVGDPTGTAISITANGQYPIAYFSNGESVIATLSGAGGSTTISVTVQEVNGGF